MASESSTNQPGLDETFQKAAAKVASVVQASESQYGLSLLASTLAHEIRNPLQSIRLQVDAARRGGSTIEALDQISASLMRLESVVGRVQQLSQRYELHPEKVNLRELVDQVIAALQFWFAATSILVTSHSSWEGEPLIEGDQELLQQVVLNILMNAIQAMPQGGTLKIDIAEALDHAVIEIEDTGCGISTDNISKVGTPFFTTKPAGNGLGLSFCKTIAALHGGSIEIHSKLNAGTCVTLKILKTLPAQKEETLYDA